MNASLRLLTTLLALTAAPLRAGSSTLGEGDSYAWAANLGWLELIPHRPAPGDGVIVADTHLSGFAWSDSTGWINFGDGTPVNSLRYGNVDGSDSGVNQDGAGNLSGLAWSANLGWINFGWWTANPSDANRPRFDLYSGAFTGYAWCANAGWISLGSGLLKTDSVCVPDSDHDGISDTWEYGQTSGANGGGSRPELTTLTATGDADGDGTSDVNEYLAGTNPFAADSLLQLLDYQPGKSSSILTWTSSPARVYRIGYSTDLQRWSWSSYLPGTEGAAETTRSQPHSLSVRRFFQVQADIPLRKR